MKSARRSEASGNRPAAARLFLAGIWLAVLAAAVIAVAAPFGSQHWLLELAAHCRWHALLVATVASLLAVVKRRRAAALLGVVFVGINAAVVAPWQWYLPSDRVAREASPAMVTRMLVWNIHWRSTGANSMNRLVERFDPDLVGIVEYGTRLAADESVATLRNRYPLSIELAADSASGLAWFAKRDTRFEEVRLPSDHVVVTAVRRQAGGTPVRYWLVHAPAPIGESLWRWRQHFYQEIVTAVKAYPDEQHIVAGDFNCTPWSPTLDAFSQRLQLVDSRCGFGHQATWPRSLGRLGIAIDHVFIPAGWRVARRDVHFLPPSDHGAVMIDLVAPGSLH